MGHLGQASEMADLAIFLASPAAPFIAGQTINCCGGFSINAFVVSAGMTATLIEAPRQERNVATDTQRQVSSQVCLLLRLKRRLE
jgi:hypothetical protein